MMCPQSLWVVVVVSNHSVYLLGSGQVAGNVDPYHNLIEIPKSRCLGTLVAQSSQCCFGFECWFLAKEI